MAMELALNAGQGLRLHDEPIYAAIFKVDLKLLKLKPFKVVQVKLKKKSAPCYTHSLSVCLLGCFLRSVSAALMPLLRPL